MTPIIPSGFLLDPSPKGGFDLFRRSPVGFVLVDSFETEAAAQAFVGGSAGAALDASHTDQSAGRESTVAGHAAVI